mgnify:CR=1 FL=1
MRLMYSILQFYFYITYVDNHEIEIIDLKVQEDWGWFYDPETEGYINEY